MAALVVFVVHVVAALVVFVVHVVAALVVVVVVRWPSGDEKIGK